MPHANISQQTRRSSVASARAFRRHAMIASPSLISAASRRRRRCRWCRTNRCVRQRRAVRTREGQEDYMHSILGRFAGVKVGNLDESALG